jgi:hypothetical protein
MSNIVIIFHSGYGHTAQVAEAVAEGSGGQLLAIDAEGNLARGRLGATGRRQGLRRAHPGCDGDAGGVNQAQIADPTAARRDLSTESELHPQLRQRILPQARAL